MVSINKKGDKFSIIKKKLLEMMRVDQRMRKDALKTGVWESRIDGENTEALKAIIREIGWPTIGKVGKKASQAAWLLAQHSSFDLPFQKRCLALIRKSYRYNHSDIEKKYIAYLIDRIAINEQRKQTFGTQFYLKKNRKYKLWPMKDVKNIGERRKEYGLAPLSKYVKLMESQKAKWEKTKNPN